MEEANFFAQAHSLAQVGINAFIGQNDDYGNCFDCDNDSGDDVDDNDNTFISDDNGDHSNDNGGDNDDNGCDNGHNI